MVLLFYTCFIVRAQLLQKLSEAQDKVTTLQSGREHVYSKLGEWFKYVSSNILHVVTQFAYLIHRVWIYTFECFDDCSQTIPMRFDVDDIGKKTRHHATECSRYLVELDKVCIPGCKAPYIGEIWRSVNCFMVCSLHHY